MIGKGADLGEILGEHPFPKLRERKFAQPTTRRRSNFDRRHNLMTTRRSP